MGPEKSLLSYGFAFLTSVFAGLLTRWTDPFLHTTYFFEFFQAAVVLSAWYGGLGPGVVAATVSFLILDYYFVPPINVFTIGPDLLRLIVFGAVAILTSALSAKLRKANRRLTKEISQRMESEKAIMEISNREQRRLGQDLHDGLSQTLAGIKLMTERVKQELKEKSAPETTKMAVIESRLAEALTFVDTVSRGLYPVELETNGLMAALEELAVKISKVYPVVCRFQCRRPVPLHDSATANHVYRIAQEAVINAIKGGKAKRIHLKLYHRGDHVILTVADDGIGLGNGPLRKGMGLKLMEYRTRVINGSLRFRSRPNGGTWVRSSFPVHNGHNESEVPTNEV